MVRHAGMEMTATEEEVYYTHSGAPGATWEAVWSGGRRSEGRRTRAFTVVSTGKSRGGKANSFRTGHLE